MISITITCDDLVELRRFADMLRDSSEDTELEAIRQALLAKRLQLQRAMNNEKETTDEQGS